LTGSIKESWPSPVPNTPKHEENTWVDRADAIPATQSNAASTSAIAPLSNTARRRKLTIGAQARASPEQEFMLFVPLVMLFVALGARPNRG
jgi:hypothetical protein